MWSWLFGSTVVTWLSLLSGPAETVRAVIRGRVDDLSLSLHARYNFLIDNFFISQPPLVN